jgi:trk system potassium uptake protein TrkH
MTFTSFVLLSNKNNIKHWRERILNAEFSMPEGFDLRDFVRSVIVFTVVIEILGAIAFFIAFKIAGVDTGFAVWSSIFHSISSFCTAGFGLYNNSFEGFADNTFINVIISVLSIAGALGFIVVLDVWQRFRGLRDKLTYTTKVICGVFLFGVAFAAIIIFFFEPSVAGMGLYDRVWVSFFQSMSAITTVGFNNIPMGVLSVPVVLALCFVMYVGSSPSGTGGGLKSTTFAAITGVVWSKIRGHHKVQFFGSRIPEARTSVAVSSFIFYTGFIFLAIFLLSFSEQTPLQNIMFEVISAISTVGLSAGITGGLTAFGKIVIISIMFIGRLGVLTFGLALLARTSTQTPPLKDETDLAV